MTDPSDRAVWIALMSASLVGSVVGSWTGSLLYGIVGFSIALVLASVIVWLVEPDGH